MKKSFRVVFKDDDRRTFNFSEVITDDTRVTDRTCELQEQGRHVSITTGTESPSGIKNTFQGYGYTFDPNLSW